MSTPCAYTTPYRPPTGVAAARRKTMARVVDRNTRTDNLSSLTQVQVAWTHRRLPPLSRRLAAPVKRCKPRLAGGDQPVISSLSNPGQESVIGTLYKRVKTAFLLLLHRSPLN